MWEKIVRGLGTEELQYLVMKEDKGPPREALGRKGHK